MSESIFLNFISFFLRNIYLISNAISGLFLLAVFMYAFIVDLVDYKILFRRVLSTSKNDELHLDLVLRHTCSQYT